MRRSSGDFCGNKTRNVQIGMKRKAEGGIMKAQLGSDIGKETLNREQFPTVEASNSDGRPDLWKGPAVSVAFRTDLFRQFLNCSIDRERWSRVRFLSLILCAPIHFTLSNYEL